MGLASEGAPCASLPWANSASSPRCSWQPPPTTADMPSVFLWGLLPLDHLQLKNLRCTFGGTCLAPLHVESEFGAKETLLCTHF